MKYFRQEYWSGLPCPPPGDLPNPGSKPRSPALQTDPLLAEPQGKLILEWVAYPFSSRSSRPRNHRGLLLCRQILYQLSYHLLSYPLDRIRYFQQIWLNSICPAAAVAKSLQLYSTLCQPIDGSPPGSSVPRILQARTLEWVAISLFNACK